MKSLQIPGIDARYWLGMALASVFGANLGDLYAHESRLGIVKGLAVLAVIVGALCAVDRIDRATREFYYWAVLLFIGAGAANIADNLFFRLRPPSALLMLSLVTVIAGSAWLSARIAHDKHSPRLPQTNAAYWAAMLGAATFGTVVGEICSHAVGQGAASLALCFALAVILLTTRRAVIAPLATYWLAVAVARSAGAALGDWLAENRILNIGLPVATVMAGLTFVAILIIWPRQIDTDDEAAAEPAPARS